MKFLSLVFIILFVTFQFSTTISFFVGNCSDVFVAVYDQEEEDENSKETKDSKELKSEFLENKNTNFPFAENLKSIKIIPFYLINKYKVSTTIIILPPEQV